MKNAFNYGAEAITAPYAVLKKVLWIMNGRWKTMKEYDSLSDNEKCNMLASVANLYYNAEMTQNQIAERFFTSRSKISRMK